MYQFFVEDTQVCGQEISITGKDQNHICHVLRMKIGEKIRVSSEDGRSFFCRIERMTDEEVIACIEEEDLLGTELASEITLFQGIPKGDKMELVVQKAVELGVSRVVPVAMKNCVAKIDEKKAQAKVNRWQAIAESAAKQCKRTKIPKICMPISWKEALEEAKEHEVVLVPYENERGMQATRELFSSLQKGQSIAIMIGPEGGYADTEITAIPEEFHRISLGRRILRTETAGPAVLAMLVYVFDE